jgi:metallo-beta-lactamase family protein
MSAHADRDGLLKWIRSFDPKPEKVFVVHGEEDVCELFAKTLNDEGIPAIAPKFTAVYDLVGGTLISKGIAEERMLEERRQGERRQDTGRRESPVYQRLLAAGTRLLDVIARNYGGSNKDLAAFTDQIINLANKWDR